jgi:hypothetical protein
MTGACPHGNVARISCQRLGLPDFLGHIHYRRCVFCSCHFILGLPGRIAIVRNHPDADAINAMGWVGFLAVVPWIQAFLWAFKPTTVIDIRYLPEDEERETKAMIARLKGGASTPDARQPPEKSPSS